MDGIILPWAGQRARFFMPGTPEPRSLANVHSRTGRRCRLGADFPRPDPPRQGLVLEDMYPVFVLRLGANFYYTDKGHK